MGVGIFGSGPIRVDEGKEKRIKSTPVKASWQIQLSM